MDSTHIIPKATDKLLPSIKRRRKKTEKERVLENIDRGEYNTYDELDNLLFKTRRYLDPNLTKKYFNYSTLEQMLESLDNTKGTYKNGVKVSLIKSGLRDLKNEIKQMFEYKIKSERPDAIVNLIKKILDFN